MPTNNSKSETRKVKVEVVYQTSVWQLLLLLLLFVQRTILRLY